MPTKFNRPLAVAIVVAAVLIAAALVYLGRQLVTRPDEARVIALIEERLGQRTGDALPEKELSSRIEKGVAASVEKQLGQRKGGELPEKEFNARVERGIVAFVEKQHRAEQDRPNQLAKNVPPPSKNDHVYGNPGAPISLIEYSDFECPYCKRFHDTAKQVADGSNGQVNLIYRHFPLEFHNPGAQKQAEASECAAETSGGNDAFWKYTDAIYARTRSNGKGFPIENLVPLAVELGLDKTVFEQCLGSGKFARRVQQQLAEGQRAGIDGTPGNILFQRATGKTVALHGAQPYERFREAIAALSK
jgi:protein-disulfide isomerase